MASWRESSATVIRRVLADKRGRSEAEIRQALVDAYPFGQRKHHPYKIWCSEVKSQLAFARREAGWASLFSGKEPALPNEPLSGLEPELPRPQWVSPHKKAAVRRRLEAAAKAKCLRCAAEPGRSSTMVNGVWTVYHGGTFVDGNQARPCIANAEWEALSATYRDGYDWQQHMNAKRNP